MSSRSFRFHHTVGSRKSLRTFELRSNAISFVYFKKKILQTIVFGIEWRQVSTVKKKKLALINTCKIQRSEP